MENIIKIVQTAKSAIFDCSICQENIKDPLLLPCNHSFCTICLKDYQRKYQVKSSTDYPDKYEVRNSKSFKCPNCSKPFTRRSNNFAPDLEGQLFKDLILSLEVGTGVDLTHVFAKDPPLVEYDKNRYILKENENVSIQKLKSLVSKEKESHKKSTKKLENIEQPSPKRSTSRKRSLPDSETSSMLKRRKKLLDSKTTDSIEKVDLVSESNVKNTPDENVVSFIESSSSSLESFRVWKTEPEKNIRTYKRRIPSKKDVRTCSTDSDIPLSSIKKVEKWLVELTPNEKLKKSKSLTPIKKTKLLPLKNKSLNETGSNPLFTQTAEMARNLESEVLNDLLQIPPPPKANSNKANWTRVKKEFRNAKYKKLDLSIQPSSRKATKLSKKTQPSKRQSNIVVIDNVSVVDSTQKDKGIIDDKLSSMIPHVVLNNYENNFHGFGKDEQHVAVLRNENLLLSPNIMRTSLIQNSKLIDQLTTEILKGDHLKFTNYTTAKECVNIAKKLRELIGLESVETNDLTNIFAENICSKCHKNYSIDLTQKITTNNALESTQRSYKNQLNVEDNNSLKSQITLRNHDALESTQLGHNNQLNLEDNNSLKSQITLRNHDALESTQRSHNNQLNQEDSRSLKNQITSENNIFESTQRSHKNQLSLEKDHTLKTTTITNENTQRSSRNESSHNSLIRQISAEIFTDVNEDDFNSELYFTPNDASNTSKIMQDVLYDMSDMEFTQTVSSNIEPPEKKQHVKDKKLASNDDDDDIIESTPKSHKSTSRVQELSQRRLSVLSQKVAVSSPVKELINQRSSLRSQTQKNFSPKTTQSENEASEHPSIILGTEFTQKVPKPRKKRSRNNDENQLDVTLIEPIETQAVNSIPIVMDLPPPTEFMDTEETITDKTKHLNNFSVLPETTMLKNVKTPDANFNIQQLKEGPILSEMSEKGLSSMESVVEQTPLTCYPPKTRINLSNTKAFKQVTRQLSKGKFEMDDDNPLEIIKENIPKRLYTGPSTSKQLSMLSYVNASQDKRLSESQISISKSHTPRNSNPPQLPISMSSQKKMNDTFQSDFDTPSSQMFTHPMASSTPARLVRKTTQQQQHQRRYIELFWTRLSVSQINLLTDFCKQLKIKFTTDNNDTTTHLITVVDESNVVEDYTLKYVCAVARGIWVLSFKWIEDCLDKNKILPEAPYEVLDTTGSPGPKMSRLREKPTILLEKFAACVLSSPATLPKDKLINCILQNGGTIYSTVEEMAANEGKIRLIITEMPETQDMNIFQDYFERYGILSITTEWLINTIATFKVESLVSYLACTLTDIVPEEYPAELLVESEMSDSTYERER